MSRGHFSISAGRVEKGYANALRRLERSEALPKIMSREASLFSKRKGLQGEIANRLGWVDVAGSMRKRVGVIEAFGNDILRAGFKHVLVLGMGGSSLCPDLFGQVFGKHERLVSFGVLDSTDPKAVKAATKSIQLDRTLFIVSSKSGSTVETRSQMMYFMGLLEHAGFTRPGRQFVAITDKGSELERFGKSEEFRKVYINPSDIGGRYSALSYFGLVPGFFAGVNLGRLLESAVGMERLIRKRNDETNPSGALAALLGAGAMQGVDKLTFFASAQTAPLVPWIEQLVAESTGKKGKGVIPIEGEAPGGAREYRDDRLFVVLRMAEEKSPVPEELKRELRRTGAPVVEIGLGSPEELGAQFVHWEAATAATGYLLGINPFDEPNVTESKKNTNEILESFRETGQFTGLTPQVTYKQFSLVMQGGKKYKGPELQDPKKLLAAFLRGLKRPGYVSFLSYLREERSIEKLVQEMRVDVRRKYGVATLRGYGPRYLHSIGQLYKGGPEVGRFIVFVREDYEGLDIPGRFYDFGQLIAAQAIGDVRALVSRDLPVLVFAIKGNASKGMKEFADVVHAICQ